MIRRPPRSTLFPLHDALPISMGTVTQNGDGTIGYVAPHLQSLRAGETAEDSFTYTMEDSFGMQSTATVRSEEHTSELQSRQYLVCRLLLEKKKKQNYDQCAII